MAISERGSATNLEAVMCFPRRRSRLAISGAVLGASLELGLFPALVGFGGVDFGSAAAFTALLLAATLGHAWFVLGARYELTRSSLRLVHGPWRRSVAIPDVLGALPLRTLDRGPIVRVELTYGRQLVLTPVDREEFLDALERVQPNLRVHAIERATRPR